MDRRRYCPQSRRFQNYGIEAGNRFRLLFNPTLVVMLSVTCVVINLRANAFRDMLISDIRRITDYVIMSLRIILLLLLSTVIVAESNAQDIVTPQSGEGIFSLLRRNGIAADNNMVAEFRELNEAKLSSTGDLKRGVSYSIPGNAADEPLFGDDFRNVEMISDELKGTVFYTISGHGGDDRGAAARHEGIPIYEDEIAYDVMLRLARLLKAYGATIYIMTKDDDGIRNGRYLEADTDERHYDGSLVTGDNRLEKRTDLINQLSKNHKGAYQRVIELHVDNFNASRQFDIDFYFWTIAGERLAYSLANTLEQKYAKVRPGRGYGGRVLKKRWHTIMHAKPIVAYVELGNIMNASNQERLLKASNRQLIAQWLLEGFLKDARQHR